MTNATKISAAALDFSSDVQEYVAEQLAGPVELPRIGFSDAPARYSNASEENAIQRLAHEAGERARLATPHQSDDDAMAHEMRLNYSAAFEAMEASLRC